MKFVPSYKYAKVDQHFYTNLNDSHPRMMLAERGNQHWFVKVSGEPFKSHDEPLNCLVLFSTFVSRMRKRAAHQYIKKIKERKRASQNKKVTGIKGL